MGSIRNGARTYLTVIAHACRLSHLPGFKSGLNKILGTAEADSLFALWEPFCALVDTLIAADDWFNKRDATTPSPSGGEDGVG